MPRESGSDRIARNGFRNITASLRDRIEAGEFIAGAYLPTERELQAGFGASRATVRKALAALIDSGWAFNVPKKGVVATRGLKPGLSKNIAFVHIDDFSLTSLNELLARLLEEKGLNLVHFWGPTNQPMEDALRRAAEENFAGAFVWSYKGFPDGDLLRMAAGQLPIIALDHRIGDLEADLVTFDHEAAAYEATEMLVQAGCKVIGITGMLDMLEITHHRICGYMRAMFDYGLQPLTNDFLFTYTSGMQEPDTSGLLHRLSSSDRPDGLLVLQDILVPATAKAIQSAGLSLSNDLKLSTIGVVLQPEVRESIVAGIELDWQSLAHQAVGLLTERLEYLHRPPKVCYAPHGLTVGPVCDSAPENLQTPDPSTEGLVAGVESINHKSNMSCAASERTQRSRSRETSL